MNSNLTITSSVSRVSFERDYFTVISFNILEMNTCGGKLIRKRHKCLVCRKHNERREIMNARNVM